MVLYLLHWPTNLYHVIYIASFVRNDSKKFNNNNKEIIYLS